MQTVIYYRTYQLFNDRLVHPIERDFGKLSYHADPKLPSDFHLTKDDKVLLLIELLDTMDLF